MTGLHYAVLKDVELVALLVEHGADVRIRDWQHCATPLGWSIYMERNDVRDYIVANCQIDIPFIEVDWDSTDRMTKIPQG